ncbi:MAG: hypothetical protein ABIO44_05925, partial [Saprospiraceae bacterium]
DEVEIKKLLDPRFAYVDTVENKVISKNMTTYDSTKFLLVSIDDYKKNPQQYSNMQITSSGQMTVNTFTTNNPDKPDVQTNIEKPIEEKKPEIVLGEITLYQYHDNSVNNKGDFPITVRGVTIPAHSSGIVRIEGDNSVVIASGNSSKTQGTTPNKKPQISFQRITSMGEDIKVSQLQRNVGYRVTISDDFPEQLEVKITGPVTFKEVGKGIFDITLNAFGSKAAFDNYTDNKNAPYQMGFNVTVKDKIAPHSVTAQNSFIFGDW